MKQRRAVARIHQPGTCTLAPGAVHTGVTAMPMATVGWRAPGPVSLSERTFGTRSDENGIPAYGTCRPKEPST